MTHSQLIDALGGTLAVARALGCNPGRVTRWRSTGIPPLRFPAVVTFAAERGVAGVTLEALFEGLPRQSAGDAA